MAGNVAQGACGWIDNITPTIGFSGATNDVWYTANKTISANSTDAQSGIKTQGVSLDNTIFSASVIVTQPSTIYCDAIDNVGNYKKEVCGTILVDGIAPSARGTIHVVSTYDELSPKYPRTITINKGADTGGSGSRGINCALTSDVPTTDTTAATCSVTINAQSDPQIVYYRTLDNAGNWSSVGSDDISNMEDGYYDLQESASYDPLNGAINHRFYAYNGAGPTDLSYEYDEDYPFRVELVSDGRSFTYDPNGNVKEYKYGTLTYTYTYDADNHLAQINGGTSGNSNYVNNSYVYDNSGNRTISKENDDAGGKIVIDISDTFEITLADSSCVPNPAHLPTPPTPNINGDNNFTSTMVDPYDICVTWKTTYSGPGAQVLRIQDTDPNTSDIQTILQDNLGSSSKVVTTATSDVKSNRYSVWGETRDTTELPTDLGYTGQETVSNLPIMYYNARWYDPSTGRFLQPDSMIPDPYNPVSLDRYAYSGNNPVNYTDPTGHWPESDDIQRFIISKFANIFRPSNACEAGNGYAQCYTGNKVFPEMANGTQIDRLQLADLLDVVYSKANDKVSADPFKLLKI